MKAIPLGHVIFQDKSWNSEDEAQIYTALIINWKWVTKMRDVMTVGNYIQRGIRTQLGVRTQ